MKRAAYIDSPSVFVRHYRDRSFIGPGTVRLSSGDILVAAPWGRPPTNFEQLAATRPTPPYYLSSDGGRTWDRQGLLEIEWDLDGMMSDGGISFRYLHDGRLACVAHRHVKGLHGGGLPVIAFSPDHGRSWTPARIVGEPEGVWYVMNDRLIEMENGRLVLPVSHMATEEGTYEGDVNLGLCFSSDDGGETWQRSRVPARLADTRGMAEPAVAEVETGRLLMLARTGSGSHHAAWSDDGGDTWSTPEPTSLAAACSPLTLEILPDGRPIVFYNHAEPLKSGSFFPRTPLCYSVSPDKGRSWGEPVLVDESGALLGDRQCIYPSICFAEEGMVVVYSVHAANPGGGFGAPDSAVLPDCGGKSCILEYPKGAGSVVESPRRGAP